MVCGQMVLQSRVRIAANLKISSTSAEGTIAPFDGGSKTRPLWLGLNYVADVLSSGVVLEKVCEYFYYNEKHKDMKDVADMELPLELCLELLMAAD